MVAPSSKVEVGERGADAVDRPGAGGSARHLGACSFNSISEEYSYESTP